MGRKEQGQQVKSIEVKREVGTEKESDFVHRFPSCFFFPFVFFFRGIFHE